MKLFLVLCVIVISYVLLAELITPRRSEYPGTRYRKPKH